MLGHEDLSVYQKGTMPEAMVYRAAFVHTRGDKGCQKVSLEIDRFFAECAGEKIFSDIIPAIAGKMFWRKARSDSIVSGKKII